MAPSRWKTGPGSIGRYCRRCARRQGRISLWRSGWGGCDYQEGGSTLEDSTAACRILAESGADLLHLTGGMNGFVRPGHQEPGYFQDMSRAAKQAVEIPVLLTGGVTTPAQAEELLEEGCADLIGVGRAIYRNPHWAD